MNHASPRSIGFVVVILLSILIFSGCQTVIAQPAVQNAASEYMIKEPYTYPVLPGTEEWLALEDTSARREACQIPEDILKRLTTEALLETVLEYPFFSDVSAYNQARWGYNAVKKRFNGLQELSTRKDLAEVVANYTLDEGESESGWSTKGEYLRYITEYTVIYYDEVPYTYPVVPGSAEWDALNEQERIDVCQIPEEILAHLSTEALLQSVLDYPLIQDLLMPGGYEKLLEQFNGIQELAARYDAQRAVIYWILGSEYVTAEYNRSITDAVVHALQDKLP